MRQIINLLIVSFLLLLPLGAGSQSLITSKHNLSVTGPGTVKATSENEVCIFCHTPHNGSKSGPLWNKKDPNVTYTIYNSSTTHAAIGQPDGGSVMCLSCHDGTIALGSVVSSGNAISFGGVTNMPAGDANLGTNLSDDHPISFVY